MNDRLTAVCEAMVAAPARLRWAWKGSLNNGMAVYEIVL